MKLNNSILTIISLFFITGSLLAQKQVKKINKKVKTEQIKKDMMYIASDALKGRSTGSAGNEEAAQYIAKVFKEAGVKVVPGMKDYFQNIPFAKIKEIKSGSINFLGNEFAVGSNLMILDGSPVSSNIADAIFLGYGLEDDYKNVDVKGKYILAQTGLPNSNGPMEVFASFYTKRALAKKNGALGLIEVYALPFSWSAVRNYFSRERIEISGSEPADLFHGVIQFNANDTKPAFESGKVYSVTVNSPALKPGAVNAVNVLGIIPGKNKALKDQYVMLSAHFDHVGVNAGSPVNGDTIWNGARDNAWGTVNLLAAARYFGKYPAERSILLAAVNAEEIGLLGSGYLADHPVLPWKQVIFNLNSDGAGYSDTTIVSVIGLNRVGAADEINEACKAFGLSTFADPAPEQGLFDRSDNVNFAKIGIPAPTFSAGFKTFDAAVQKYYHQSIDNPDNISYPYLFSFTKSFVYTTQLISAKKELPRWVAGDKYEPASKKLYGY